MLISCSCTVGSSDTQRGGAARVEFKYESDGEECAVNGPPLATYYDDGDTQWVDISSDGDVELIRKDGLLYADGAVVPGLDADWIAIDVEDPLSSGETLFAAVSIVGRLGPWFFGSTESPDYFLAMAGELEKDGRSSPVADDSIAPGVELSWSAEADHIGEVTVRPIADRLDPLVSTSIVMRPIDVVTDAPPLPDSAVVFSDVDVGPLLASSEMVDQACGASRTSLAQCLMDLSRGLSVDQWLRRYPPGETFGEQVC